MAKMINQSHVSFHLIGSEATNAAMWLADAVSWTLELTLWESLILLQLEGLKRWVLPHEYLMRWPSSSLGQISVPAERLQTNTRDLRARLCCLKHIQTQSYSMHCENRFTNINKSELTACLRLFSRSPSVLV